MDVYRSGDLRKMKTAQHLKTFTRGADITRQTVQSGSGVRNVSVMRQAPKNETAAATMIR